MKKLLLVGLCVLTLFGCGFHLQQALPLAPPLQQLYLQTNDPYGSLARYLRQYLKSSHVVLTNTPQEATTVLVILSEEKINQLLGVSATLQTRQYNLILRVNFQVTDAAGRVLVPIQTVTETVALTIEANQILAGSNEENYLYEQMRHAIVNDIMNRLSSLEVTRLVTGTADKPT